MIKSILKYFTNEVINWFKLLGLFLAPFILIFIYLKACAKPNLKLNQTSSDISSLSEAKKISLDPVVTIIPKDEQDGTGRVEYDFTGRIRPLDSQSHEEPIKPVRPINMGTSGTDVSTPSNPYRAWNQDRSPSSQTGLERISGYCGRRSCVWDANTGTLSYRRYNFSFAPGVEIFRPKGMGFDTRFFRLGDFASIIGAAYFTKTKEVDPSFGLTYNLRRTRVLSNCDLFVSYTPKTIIGGLRLELGEY